MKGNRRCSGGLRVIWDFCPYVGTFKILNNNVSWLIRGLIVQHSKLSLIILLATDWSVMERFGQLPNYFGQGDLFCHLYWLMGRLFPFCCPVLSARGTCPLHCNCIIPPPPTSFTKFIPPVPLIRPHLWVPSSHLDLDTVTSHGPLGIITSTPSTRVDQGLTPLKVDKTGA